MRHRVTILCGCLSYLIKDKHFKSNVNIFLIITFLPSRYCTVMYTLQFMLTEEMNNFIFKKWRTGLADLCDILPLSYTLHSPLDVLHQLVHYAHHKQDYFETIQHLHFILITSKQYDTYISFLLLRNNTTFTFHSHYFETIQHLHFILVTSKQYDIYTLFSR